MCANLEETLPPQGPQLSVYLDLAYSLNICNFEASLPSTLLNQPYYFFCRGKEKSRLTLSPAFHGIHVLSESDHRCIEIE